MPVLMRLERLRESGSFLCGGKKLAVESTGGLEDAVNTGGTEPHDVLIEHHEGQPTVSFQGMPVVKLQNGGPLPCFEPMIAGDLAVVFIDLAIPVFPGVELAGGTAKMDWGQPGEDGLGGCFGAIGPVTDVVHHLVACVMGNPTSVQSSPSFFWFVTRIRG